MPLEEGFQGRFPGGSLSVLTPTVLYSTFLFCFKPQQPRQSHPRVPSLPFSREEKRNDLMHHGNEAETETHGRKCERVTYTLSLYFP